MSKVAFCLNVMEGTCDKLTSFTYFNWDIIIYSGNSSLILLLI